MKLSNNSYFVILIFAILKFWSIDRCTFRQISEDVPVPGEVLIAEGIRVYPKILEYSQAFDYPTTFGYSTEKNWNYPTRPNPKKCSTRTLLYIYIYIVCIFSSQTHLQVSYLVAIGWLFVVCVKHFDQASKYLKTVFAPIGLPDRIRNLNSVWQLVEGNSIYIPYTSPRYEAKRLEVPRTRFPLHAFFPLRNYPLLRSSPFLCGECSLPFHPNDKRWKKTLSLSWHDRIRNEKCLWLLEVSHERQLKVDGMFCR